MALYRDEGVVLRTVKLGEADRIVTVLTKEHGKVRAVAKGVRRVKSRFGGRLEPFMRIDLLIAEGRSLDVVSQAASIGTYAAEICIDFEAYSAANVIVETADKLVSTEHERARDQYLLAIGALNALAKHMHEPTVVAQSYVMRALSAAGWTPRLDSCVVCGRRDELAYFSTLSGGMMCLTDRTPEATRLSREAYRQLRALISGDWASLDEAVYHGGAVQDGAEQDTMADIGHRIGQSAAESADPKISMRSGIGEGHVRAPTLADAARNAAQSAVARIVEEWGEYYLERPIRSLRLLHS